MCVSCCFVSWHTHSVSVVVYMSFFIVMYYFFKCRNMTEASLFFYIRIKGHPLHSNSKVTLKYVGLNWNYIMLAMLASAWEEIWKRLWLWPWVETWEHKSHSRTTGCCHMVSDLKIFLLLGHPISLPHDCTKQHLMTTRNFLSFHK